MPGWRRVFCAALGALIAQNPNEAQRLLELLPRAHVDTCEMPLYTAFTAEEISQEQARQRLGIPPQRPVLLFFGIVRPYKGLPVLLDALAMLKRQGQPPFLLVAGEFWEDVQDYRGIISRLALEDDVRLENRYIPNEEVDVLFSAADMLVAPYLAGTQSAAVALALGRGLPAVLTERIAAGVPPAARDLTPGCARRRRGCPGASHPGAPRRCSPRSRLPRSMRKQTGCAWCTCSRLCAGQQQPG